MALKVAGRGRVDPFIALDVLRMANERSMAGGDVLHLEIGQPGGSAPKAVIEAAKRALESVRSAHPAIGQSSPGPK